jgi:hypothetical protein
MRKTNYRCSGSTRSVRIAPVLRRVVIQVVGLPHANSGKLNYFAIVLYFIDTT